MLGLVAFKAPQRSAAFPCRDSGLALMFRFGVHHYFLTEESRMNPLKQARRM